MDVDQYQVAEFDSKGDLWIPVAAPWARIETNPEHFKTTFTAMPVTPAGYQSVAVTKMNLTAYICHLAGVVKKC